MPENWIAYDIHRENKRAALTAIFFTGLEKKIAPLALCHLLGDITLLDAHDTENIVRLAYALVEYAPDQTCSWSAYAQSLRLNDQMDDAKKAVDKGLDIDPDCIGLLTLLGKLSLESGDVAKAEHVLRRAFDIDPQYSVLPLCEALIKAGSLDEAEKRLSDTVRQSGRTTSSEATSYIINLLKGGGKAQKISEYGKLLQQSQQSEHFNPDEMARFNQELSDCLNGHPALLFEPSNTATAQGRQAAIHNLLPPRLIDPIITMLQTEAERFFERNRQHEFMNFRPEKLNITSWAVVLEKGGYQHPHIHPGGWLSGVYYVEVGREYDEDGNGGAIEFLKPPESLIGDVNPETIVIKPQNGLMLLFPSHFYHHTIPHTGEKERISISFDIN
ncbi:putative 2OG-Fe(II) oxygenase [Parasphingorhabdus sp.]|jgi:tetratricopeptide (TPR) repeat protein|uniref:putative 2OG-Fe(II) oxygenase n=1 Tax=Parasphingorhabdus sp. TaxID=2709688 RepID=UPI0039E5A944